MVRSADAAIASHRGLCSNHRGAKAHADVSRCSDSKLARGAPRSTTLCQSSLGMFVSAARVAIDEDAIASRRGPSATNKDEKAHAVRAYSEGLAADSLRRDAADRDVIRGASRMSKAAKAQAEHTLPSSVTAEMRGSDADARASRQGGFSNPSEATAQAGLARSCYSAWRSVRSDAAASE